MVKILVAGGRGFDDKECVFAALDAVHRMYGVTELVHGACGCNEEFEPEKMTGADKWAHFWAEETEGVTPIPYPAEWRKYGKPAGMMRNRKMHEKEKPEMGVMFPGGNGTAGMKKILEDAGIPIVEVIVRDNGDRALRISDNAESIE